ncbi:hypothetical protein AB0K71_15835 [Streptomyces syringium]
MRQFEEMEEHERLGRELGDLMQEFTEPQGLGELGYDLHARCFRGERIA